MHFNNTPRKKKKNYEILKKYTIIQLDINV